MSGCGRKHRAKHLTQQYLDSEGWTNIGDGQEIAVCVEAPHGHHVRVLRVPPPRMLVTEGDSAPTEAEGEEEPVEKLALVPGKFQKVIWLAVRDVIVLEGDTLLYKPSPEQLERFCKDPATAAWRAPIERTRELANERRRKVERMPLFNQTTNTTTSVLKADPFAENAKAKKSSLEGGEDDDIFSGANRNRQNIRHRQQFFYGEDDEDDEEEEEEVEDEEETEEGTK